MATAREQVVSVLGPVDEEMIAEIISTGASLDELREAWGWVFGDEASIGQGRPLPGTRIAALIDLFEPDADEIEGPVEPGRSAH